MVTDYEYQSNYVIENAWRILSLQDKDISSPSYGNFHYSYWRDKTSEFADSRFQEAGATLGILSSKKYAKYHGSSLPTKNDLYQGFSAALKNLSKLQYANGSFDEWYKGERGFAATEFTSIAFGLAAIILGEELKGDDKDRLIIVLEKSGNWLSEREDKIKSNHQAAAAAALALIWKITEKSYFLDNAKKAMHNTLQRQTKEGWFPEIGGMDLGYSWVLLDYCMIYNWITCDHSVIKPMKKLISFVLPHMHPDGSISPEAGICQNPYVSRLGLCIISQYSEEASWLLDKIQNNELSIKVFEPYLADDLRFCRWSHLPLVSNLLFNKFKSKFISTKKEYFQKGWNITKKSSLVSYHSNKVHIYISVAGGGVIRVFENKKLIFEEKGVILLKNKKVWNTKGYKIPRNISLDKKIISFEGDFHEAKYSFPSFLSRLILRILCINQTLSKLTRQMIDQYRLKSGTAVNQSAGSIHKSSNNIVFLKSLRLDENKMHLKYEIPSKTLIKLVDDLIIDFFAPNHFIEIKNKDSKVCIDIKFEISSKNVSYFRKKIKIKDLSN